ncbi:MAG TPA: Rieske 2Fe-2S domain-containing protein [Nitrosopumilaceae archaeon]|nr:Rieske 2Fe-2S domain-containing protein [Nitrosopumilaceae archaeon]
MSEQGSDKKSTLSRRDFLKLLTTAGAGIAFAPFIPWGKFMPNPQNHNLERAKIILPDGTHANVNSFPINHAEVVTYPTTGDSVLDMEAFRKWQLLRLPEEFGGNNNDVSAFRIYSNVCVHLWCLWKYRPSTNPTNPGRNRIECPCHGSVYDPLTGMAVAGPASLQAPPSNVLPQLDMESDSEGFLYIIPPKLNINSNGVVGYGRFMNSN